MSVNENPWSSQSPPRINRLSSSSRVIAFLIHSRTLPAKSKVPNLCIAWRLSTGSVPFPRKFAVRTINVLNLSQSEVEHLQAPILVNHHVVRLEIAMDDSMSVRRSNSTGKR